MKIKNNLFPCKGINQDLQISFTASAIGCKTPANLTLLGPNRNWIYPKIFRSNKV